MLSPSRPLSTHPPRRRHHALTLLECLILLSIMSIVAVGVSWGMEAMAGSARANDREEVISTEIASELETWRTTPFATLSTLAAGSGTTTSDTVSLSFEGSATSFPRKVSILQMDPTNPATNASPQSDFIQIQVTIATRTGSLWVTKP